MTPGPDTVVGAKYRIVRPLGEGGMGTVYEAVNLLTLKRAAIKWLHPRLLAAETAAKRLLFEARATSRIRHRNVVDVYDVLQQHDSAFLVMELLIGESLAAHLERSAGLALPQLIGLLLPAMRGVEAAHAVGVVHRDIKPDNIFLAQEAGSDAPVPKVIDFGISRVFSGSEQERATRSGMTMGTPRYASYEQLRGARDVDVRADVYAFGVILYESLVGAPPYAGTTLSEQAIRIATTIPRPPHEIRPELPLELSELVMAAIEKERDDRIATIAELFTRIEPFSKAAAYPEPLRAFPPRSKERVCAQQVDSSAAPTVEAPSSLLEGPRAAESSASLLGFPRRRRMPLRLALVGVVTGVLLSWKVLPSDRSVVSSVPSGAPAAARDASALAEVPARAAVSTRRDAVSPPASPPMAARSEVHSLASDVPRPAHPAADAGPAAQPHGTRERPRRARRPSPKRPSRAPELDEHAAPQSPPLRAGGMSKHEF